MIFLFSKQDESILHDCYVRQETLIYKNILKNVQTSLPLFRPGGPVFKNIRSRNFQFFNVLRSKKICQKLFCVCPFSDWLLIRHNCVITVNSREKSTLS